MARLFTKITSISKVSYGHWKIVVEKQNFNKQCHLSSVTKWKYTTTDSMLIDDYNRGESYAKVRQAENMLIYMAKKHGSKRIIKI